LWDDNGCPLKRDVVPYEDLFVEPFYQLLRQQLLAWRMEHEQERDARLVRVVHICPVGNEGVHAALNRPSHAAAGDDVVSIWSSICRTPGRFITMDSAAFASAAVRSHEYVDRYAIGAGRSTATG
jgi:hypothetical protein